MRNATLLMAGTLVALAACNADSPPAHSTTVAVPATPAVTPLPSTSRDATPTVQPTVAGTAVAPASGPAPAFVDVPWKVSDSPGGQAGATYTFARDGTLTIDAPGDTPSTGRWSYADGKLTMTEDGVAYPTDIVSLDESHFVIRSHNPGGVVEIAMVSAR